MLRLVIRKLNLCYLAPDPEVGQSERAGLLLYSRNSRGSSLGTRFLDAVPRG